MDPVWNAGRQGVKSMADDVQSGAKSMAANASTAVDNGIDKGLGWVNNNISQPMAQAGQSVANGARGAYAGAVNAVDSGIDSGLNWVNNNISAPMYGAASGAQQGWDNAHAPQGSPAQQMHAQGMGSVPPRAIPVPGAAVMPPTPPAPPAQLAAPAPVAPPQQQPDYSAQFRQQHGGAFDPNSAMDRQKMQQLQGGVFKQAGASEIAAILGKALDKGKRAYGASRPTEGILAGAKHAVGGAKNVVAEAMGGAQNRAGAHSLLSGIKNQAGAAKGALSNRLKNMDKGYAGAAGIGLAAGSSMAASNAVGMHRGRTEGFEDGMNKGFDSGKDLGAERGAAAGYDAAAKSLSSKDPGVMGRFKELFTGRGDVLDPADEQAAARRAAALQQILSGM